MNPTHSNTDYQATNTVMSAGTAAVAPPARKRISWGAIFAGAILALVVQLALSLLGLGVGLGTIDPLEESNPMSGIGTGAAIWWGISTLIALFVGGVVAGRLAGVPRRTDGLLHGLLTWALVTLFTFYLLSTAVGRIISGVGGVAGRTLSAAGRGIASVAPEAADAVKGELQERGIDLNDLKREARTILRQTGKPELRPENLEREARGAAATARTEAGQAASNPQAADEGFDDVIDRITNRGQGIASAADRDAAVNVVMQRTGKSRAESEQVVNNWISSYEQARAKFEQTKQQAAAQVRQTGDKAAEGLSKAALFTFVGLVLGAGAAAVGGRQATPHDGVGTV